MSSASYAEFLRATLQGAKTIRIVWRFAQEKQMIWLTANRSMKGEKSLEQVMREENTPTSLPVVTIGNAERILSDSEYRGGCVESLI